MKDDVHSEIMSTRLTALENTVREVQDEMKRIETEIKNNAGLYIKHPKERVVTNSRISFVDLAGAVSTPLIGFTNDSVANNSTIKQVDVSNLNQSEDVSPTCLIDSKHGGLYGVLFLIVNVLAVLISCFYIHNAYKTWQASPVVQALSNSQVHFENISFPAVTICFPNSFKHSYDFSGEIETCLSDIPNTSCTYEQMATLALANLMCSKYSSEDQMVKNLFKTVPEAIDGNEFDTYMETLFPPCESDVVTLQLSYDRETSKNYTRCDSDVFQQFYSYNHNRLCMTYNSLPHQDIFTENVVTAKVMGGKRANITDFSNPLWSFDTMMNFKGGFDTIPIYGLEKFRILIHEQQSEYENICTHLSKEVASVIIHSPNEIPLDFDIEIEHMIRKNVRIVKMFEVLVMPKISLARDDLAQYPPHQRSCLFSHEGNLSMFKLYTKKNCEFECIVNLYLQACGCVPYFYPRQNSSVKVCLQPCPRPKNHCDCLPDCNHLTYDLVTQEVPDSYSADANSTPRAYIQVMIRGKKFYKTIRYSITSFAEFIAYSLGVLGVFLGFSVTCMWRLLYFGALRLWTGLSEKSSCNKSVYPSSVKS